MSDVPPGPGWWIASDGRWYPPESHPSVAAPSPWVPEHRVAAATQGPSPQWGAPSPGWGAAPTGWGPQPGYGSPPGYGPPPGAYAMGSPLFIDPLLGLPLAPWWKRACALLIDSVILGVALVVIFLVTFAALGTAVRATNPAYPGVTTGLATGAVLLIYVVAIGTQFVYYGLLNGSSRGQTVGKMALHIAVRDARTGGPIGFWRAVGRDAILVVFDIPFGIPLIIDYLAPLWDSRRQAWHDKVVHSVVIELPS